MCLPFSTNYRFLMFLIFVMVLIFTENQHRGAFLTVTTADHVIKTEPRGKFIYNACTLYMVIMVFLMIYVNRVSSGKHPWPN
jgi:hypothetical protein